MLTVPTYIRTHDHPRRRRGNILISMLLGLFGAILALSLMISVFKLITRQDFMMRQLQDQLQLRQLRRLLLRSQDLQVLNDQLTFKDQGEVRQLRISREWLLIQPGTWILADEVQSVRFWQDQHAVWIELDTRHGTVSEVIGWAE